MGSDMSGLDSWIKLHICDPRGQCCQSQAMSTIPMNDYKSWGSSVAEDPCNAIVLNKSHPDQNGQLVRVEHWGPDGTELDHFNIHLNDDTYLECKSRNHPAEKIVLPDSARKSMDLDCMAVYVIW